MYLTVKQTVKLRGKTFSPSSKSQSIRGMLFALLAKGESTLLNVLEADDTQEAINVCTRLGVRISKSEQRLTLNSTGTPLSACATEINTGNSGITTLFVLPLLGLRENYATPILFNCGKQMRGRPITPLIDALRYLGMHIQYTEQEGQLPILVSGQLKGGTIELDGTNSQYLSALLIGLPCAKHDSIITVNNLHERPYVEMTLNWLQLQGIDYQHQCVNNLDTFYIKGNQQYTPVHATIMGDYSSASCLIAAAVLLASELELDRLDSEDTQGDKRLVTILQEMGADITIERQKLRIKGKKTLRGIRIDANDIPDLLPALAVIATKATGKTEIYNVAQARIKETDRIHSMVDGLRKMGATIEEHADGMTIYQSRLQGAAVEGYDDHRTVMALTVAGMIAEGMTTISDGNAINKTYPQFVTTMQSLGANITAQRSITTHHIILIGFKYVGKSLIGLKLAKKLNKNFIDLDKELEKLYEKDFLETLTCHEIMQKHGENQYRELESAVLRQTLKSAPSIISLGGGAALRQVNQDMIKSHILLHVIAPRGIVFERIMVEGRPAFFDISKDPYEAFSRLWDDREKIYKNLSTHIVNNDQTIAQAVNEAIAHLHNLQDGSSYA